MSLEVNQKVIEKYNVQLYQGTHEQDVQLLRLWISLTESGEIDQIFLPSSQRLFEFLRTFQNPAVAAYSLNSAGEIDFIAWFTPFETATPSAFVGVWSGAKIRGTRKLVELMGTIYETAFTFWNHLFGVTRQKLIAQHQKIGYTMAGVVPGFYADEDGVTVFLNRENFTQSRVFGVYKKLQGN